jgi:glycosyltransferase involved in cell wall biosynthesis
MRILQICSARAIGGGERHLIDLTNALAGKGHDLYAALAPNSPLRSELITALPEQNIITLRLRNALDVGSALRLARFARERNIEIIHAHMARDYPIAALAAHSAGQLPYILTRHVLFPLNKLQRFALRRVARVISVSQAVADNLRAQKIFPEQRIAIIPNGIRANLFFREADASSRVLWRERLNARAAFFIGIVGHLAPIKGQEDFLRAAALIAERRKDTDFVIIGEDKARGGEHRARLERLIAELDLRERVHLLGWLDDVIPVLGALDLAVSASRAEPFGLAIIEAMASGAPVIATISEGAREIIEDGVTGKLVPIGDTEALAKAIDELLDNPSSRKRMATRARQTVCERFSLEQMVAATEEVYRTALAGKS